MGLVGQGITCLHQLNDITVERTVKFWCKIIACIYVSPIWRSLPQQWLKHLAFSCNHLCNGFPDSWAVCSCLPDLGHKKVIVVLHVKQQWPKLYLFYAIWAIIPIITLATLGSHPDCTLHRALHCQKGPTFNLGYLGHNLSHFECFFKIKAHNSAWYKTLQP